MGAADGTRTRNRWMCSPRCLYAHAVGAHADRDTVVKVPQRGICSVQVQRACPERQNILEMVKMMGLEPTPFLAGKFPVCTPSVWGYRAEILLTEKTSQDV